MAVSSTLVNVSEDAEVRLVSLLSESAPPELLGATFAQDCSASIAAANAAALVQTIIHDQGAVAALTRMPLKDATAAVSILAALLQRTVDPPDLAQTLAQAVCQVVVEDDDTTSTTTSPVQATLRKITILSILYNMRSSGVEKCALLTRMYELAAPHATELFPASEAASTSTTTTTATSVATTLSRLLWPATTTTAATLDHTSSSTLSSSTFSLSTTTPRLYPTLWIPRLVTLVESWQQPADIPMQMIRHLYRTVAQQLPTHNDVRTLRFWLLVTESYNNDNSKDDDTNDKEAPDLMMQAATQAAMGAIRDPVTLFRHQRHLLQQPAIQGLQQHNPPLYKLLKVFQQGQMADYQALVGSSDKKAAAFLEPLGLQPASCQGYMRILSLCDLAAQHEEIPYQTIQQTLHLESGTEVERWVIAAVSSGLLQAKMDQLCQMVLVERCVVRQLDTVEQWKVLQTRLASWKNTVGGILASVKESRNAVAAAAAVN